MKIIYIFTFAFLFTCSNVYSQTPLTQAVDFDVTTVHGEEVNLFELLDAGKHVVVDFFFTTCGPCIESVPTVNETFERFGCNNGDVYFISIDTGDSDAQVSQYEADYGGLLPSVSGNEGGGNAVNAAYNIPAWPTIILIAPDRTIVSNDIFPVTPANFNTALITNAGLTEKPEACAITGINDFVEIGTSIKAAMPNPASSIAALEIEMEKAGEIRVEIYNLIGQQVAHISKQDYSAGRYTIDLPINQLSNGTYSVNLIHDNVMVDVTKLTVMK